ncbi:MAG: AI-2E family transporter, partial [Acidobacteria bacterium]|nr:AI-2E family transporter [Acidobacteriota bacterium]
VCGLLNLVPRFGGLIAMALAFLLALAFRGFLDALGALGVCVFVQAIEGFVLTPRILGRRLQMPALAVFLAVLLGGALFGFLGMLLAVPALAVLNVIWKFVRDSRSAAGGGPSSGV